MTAPKMFTKKDLRGRGWTHSQIKAMTKDDTVKTGERGRPAFGFKVSSVLEAEQARGSVS